MTVSHHLGWALLAFVFLASAVECTDYYAILGVPRDADATVIKRAYRNTALRYHPDKVDGGEAEKKEAEKKFSELSAAYEVLSDSEKRQMYDQFGEAGLKQMGEGGGGGVNPNHLFSRFFGGGFGFGGAEEQSTPRGDDVHVHVVVTLEQIFSSATVPLQRRRTTLVEGSGTRRCRCRQKMVTQQVGPGMYQQYSTEVCDQCTALKPKLVVDYLLVVVDRGVPDQHSMSFFEQGEPVEDGDAGDLVVHLRTRKHPVFERQGDDLRAAVNITLLEALVGFERQMAHLDGGAVEIGAREQVTRPGLERRFEGQGMPRHDKPGRGDLYVTYTVVFPTELDEAQRKLARDMLATANWHDEL